MQIDRTVGVHAATSHLAAAVRALTSTSEQLDRLRDAYAGQECFIVTCGPSLSTLDDALLDGVVRGQLTIAVKHAVERVRDHADFLVFNSYNVRRYPRGPHTVSVFAPEPTGRMKQHNRADLVLPYVHGPDPLAGSLAVTRDFDAHTLDRTPVRPHGPGIMYEVAFYLAVHLGVRRITTLGWDIADRHGRNLHYYDREPSPPAAAVSRRGSPVRRGQWLEPYRAARAWVAHQRGQTYNPATMKPGEAELVAGSLEHVARWLASHDVELRVVSESPWFSDHVTGVSPKELRTQMP